MFDEIESVKRKKWKKNINFSGFFKSFDVLIDEKKRCKRKSSPFLSDCPENVG